MLYLVATALSRQDRYPPNTFEIILRLVLGVLILLKLPAIANTALIVTVIYLLYHPLGAKKIRMSEFNNPEKKKGDRNRYYNSMER